VPRPECRGGARVEQLHPPALAGAQLQQLRRLLADAGLESLEAHAQLEAPIEADAQIVAALVDQRRHRGRLELGLTQGEHHPPDAVGVEVGEEHRPLGLGQRVQPEGHRGDEPQGPQRAHHQLREVESGDVLHHLAAASSLGAVGAHDGDADDQIPDAAVPGAPRPEGVGRHQPPERRPGGPGGVQGQHLSGTGEHRLERGQPHPRLDGHDLIQWRVLDDSLQALGAEHHLHPGRGRAERQLGAPAEEDDPPILPCRLAKQLGRLAQRAGALLPRRRQRLGAGHRRHPRPASPASSVAWGR